MGFAITFVLFIALMVVTTLVFGVWIVFGALRALGRLFTSGTRTAASPQPFDVRTPMNGSSRCIAAGCHHTNPAGARFCRHCGRALPIMQYSPTFGAAMGDRFHA